MSARHGRTESQVMHACDRVAEAAGATIVRLLPGRADGPQTRGLARRRYYLPVELVGVTCVAVWWAPRTERGRINAALRDFLALEYRCGAIVGIGDDHALSDVLSLLKSHGTRYARERACERMLAEHFVEMR